MKPGDSKSQRIVVKVGTSSLVSAEGKLDTNKLSKLVGEISALKARGNELVIVSSGAIRAGMQKLGMAERPKTIPEQQAAAAVGQSALMRMYEELFEESGSPSVPPPRTEALAASCPSGAGSERRVRGRFFAPDNSAPPYAGVPSPQPSPTAVGEGVVCAQVLLTRDDFRHRTRYLNARNTLLTLLRFGCVPIVNENDTVATEEIRFGENDTLSALVAASVDADLLINLSDVDGLYDSDPRLGGECNLIPEVREIGPSIEGLAGGQGETGSGGMRSKLDAAKIAVNSGVQMVIANAARANVVLEIADGQNVGTCFLSKPKTLNQRKRWIAFGSRVKGKVIVNDGAKTALVKQGKSLLSVGVTGCTGAFEVGDLVSVVDEAGTKIARGLANYSCEEIDLIRGKRSEEIEAILGHKDFDEVIHRDNLVLGV